ncbi:DUF2330 domain-containing protein [Patescibacteria group bacterium]|nr:DUF2330 domain-containing protein [Patescibacteria group bacterium]
MPLTAFACGIAITSTSSGWFFGLDSSEQSFINHENGTEKLIISREFDKAAYNTVWVIPIPAPAKSIKVDVLSEIPRFIKGENVEIVANAKLQKINDLLLSSQIYPLPFVVIKNIMQNVTGSASIGTSKFSSLGATLPDEGTAITVFQHLEKNGMVSEVLSATNSQALYDYLKAKNLKVEKDSITVLQDYIGEGFSFVVSWVRPTFGGVAAKGVLMNFPAKNMYYPLKPGSVYTGEGLPEKITVMGHVTPKLYPGIKDTTTVRYYYSEEGIDSKDFFSSSGSYVYTEIVVKTQPSNLTEDLYFSKIAPMEIYNAMLAFKYTIIYGVFLLLTISYIATRLALDKLHIQIKNMGGLVILNCLTLFGTIVGSRIYLTEKRGKFVITYSIIFIIVTLSFRFVSAALYGI